MGNGFKSICAAAMAAIFSLYLGTRDVAAESTDTAPMKAAEEEEKSSEFFGIIHKTSPMDGWLAVSLDGGMNFLTQYNALNASVSNLSDGKTLGNTPNAGIGLEYYVTSFLTVGCRADYRGQKVSLTHNNEEYGSMELSLIDLSANVTYRALPDRNISPRITLGANYGIANCVNKVNGLPDVKDSGRSIGANGYIGVDYIIPVNDSNRIVIFAEAGGEYMNVPGENVPDWNFSGLSARAGIKCNLDIKQFMGKK